MTKDKKMKVPKRIAGVKVPKKIRKPVNKALAIAENPATRDLAVAALTAAAAALAKKSAEAAPRPRQPGEAGTDANGTGNLTDVIIAAALDGARRLLDNRGGDGPAEAEVVEAPAALEAAPEPAAKRRRSAASGPAAAPRQDA
jgi:hypothetical protein